MKEKESLMKKDVKDPAYQKSPNPHAKKFKVTNRVTKRQKEKFVK